MKNKARWVQPTCIEIPDTGAGKVCRMRNKNTDNNTEERDENEADLPNKIRN